MKYTHTVPSPIGPLGLIEEDGALVAVTFPGERVPEDAVPDLTPLLEAAARELGEYFALQRLTFSLPLRLQGPPFRQKAWKLLADIPFGETRTYGELARRIGSPGAARAVGGACHTNPLPIFIPCHRVIGSDRTLTGYRGGLEAKRALLELEKPRYVSCTPEAMAYLASRDPALGEVIAREDPVQRPLVPDPFAGLIRCFTAQQVSRKAAQAIEDKLRAVLGAFSPEAVLSAGPKVLRAAGLSSRKAADLVEIARTGLPGTDGLSDDEIIERLTALPGVGVWTARMLLLFTFGRPDVLSYEDFGIRRGIMRLHGLSDLPRETFETYRALYSPYGSAASLYLWKIT